ncbi:hypothetical protein Tco_1287325, partial [Tanacetum coccineum]
YRVGRGRLGDASATRVFGYEPHEILLFCFLTWLSIINREGIRNGGGRHRDISNMCGSDHGRGGNFGQGRGDIGKHGCDRGAGEFRIWNRDVPITPFTFDMSAARDGIVTGLMNKLIVQTHLMTDKEYSVHSIDYAINPSGADGHDLEDVCITMNKGDGDDSEEDEVMIEKRHDDYDSEDIDDMETDDEEPVCKRTMHLIGIKGGI